MKKVTIELERETQVESPNGISVAAMGPQRVNVMDRVMEVANKEGLQVYRHDLRSAREVLRTRTVQDPVRTYGTHVATMTEETVEYVWSVDIYLQ